VSTVPSKIGRLLKRQRTYRTEEDISVPISSRHHPERASIWVAEEPRVGYDIMGDLPPE
jgi:hypothetical protein